MPAVTGTQRVRSVDLDRRTHPVGRIPAIAEHGWPANSMAGGWRTADTRKRRLRPLRRQLPERPLFRPANLRDRLRPIADSHPGEQPTFVPGARWLYGIELGAEKKVFIVHLANRGEAGVRFQGKSGGWQVPVPASS